MGRADYTDKNVALNGTGVLCNDETGNSRPRVDVQAKAATSHWPLSFSQQRLWFLEQLHPGTAAYNMPLAARIKGALNRTAFEQALNAVIERHESLRTRFVCVDGQPRQVIDKAPHFKPRVEDLSGLTSAEQESELKWRIHDEINRSFDLSKDQLIRALLFRLSNEEHVFVVTMHHIVSDEWSLNIFFKELGAFYEGFATGETVEVPQLQIQYGDFAVWQHVWLKEKELETPLNFWKEHLKGNPPAIELPTDFPRRPSCLSHGATLTRFLSRAMEKSLRSLAKREETTLFMVLLAAFKTLLYRYTQQEDIVISSPMAGRNRLELEGLIGFFVNILPLRTSFAGNPPFKSLLRRVRELTLAACSHQEAPFEKIVQELHPERSISETPFARVLFMLQNSPFERMRWRTGVLPTLDSLGAIGSGKESFLDLQFLEAHTDTSKFELSVTVQETSRGLAVLAEYDTGLFAKQSIERLLEHFEILLQGISTNPDSRVSELPILGDGEKKQLLLEWNSTASDFPRDKCIHELFQENAERTPDALAAVFGQNTITFRELNRRANQLAHHLQRYHIEANTPVGLCVEPSIEMLVGMLGILKLGGAYVPLDPNYPAERLAFMLEDTKTPVVITQQALIERIPGEFPNIVCLDSDWNLIAPNPCDDLPNPVTAADLAYVMYTSGSTGQPKGVKVRHRGVTRLVLNTNYIQLDSTDRIGQISNISFDAATFEIWGALLNRAQLVGIASGVAVSPKEFAHELRDRGITTIFLTSALFTHVANQVPGAFESLRTVIAGGEALDPGSVRAVLRNGPPRRLVNGYGPTENTTFTCYHCIRELPDAANNVPIGRPISNTQVYILDSFLNPVSIGAAGELYVGGDGLADGYWNRPELTSEKFVPNPFINHSKPDERNSALLYRTGDLARYLPNGEIQFLGRRDEQVKIRGFRIELGEVESVLRRHPAIRDCAVNVFAHGPADKRLAAYFVSKREPKPIPGDLRAFIKKRLPDYMVPSAFVSMATLPLTPNGKLDRKALPNPSCALTESETYQHPRDEIESRLARIWEEVLDTRPVGIRDRFFDLGGHSLLAVRLVSRIEEEFSRKLRVSSVFQAQTVEELAALIRDKSKASQENSSIVEIQAKGERPPLFLVHGAGGGMFWGYANLSRHLGASQPIYGFRSRSLDGVEEFSAIEEMAAQYVSDLRKVQSTGPYYLGGYCFGGVVAYEMARQLACSGEKIELLALLNCAPPNSRYTRINCNPRWCFQFLKNLFYWVGYVRQLTPSKRLDFARWKWHRLKQWFRDNSKSSDGHVSVGNLVDLSSFAEDERKVWEQHIRALLKYRPQPYTGAVHLFRSPGHQVLCSFDADFGWGEFAKGGVVTSIVSGAHEKILEEPCVADVAAGLEKRLSLAKRAANAPIQVNGKSHKPPEEDDIAFWKEQLAGAPALLELPTDRSRPPVQSRQTEVQTRECSRPLAGKSPENCSVIPLAAIYVLLHRYSNQHDLVVANSVEDKFAVVRINLSDNPTAKELLYRIRNTQTETLKHGNLPFSRLIQELRPSPDTSYQPLCQVAFSYGEPGRVCESTCKFDLEFILEDAKKPVLKIRYATDLFEAETIRRMLAQWELVLREIVEHPNQRLSQLNILPPEEEHLLLIEWNDTRKEYPREKTLVELIEKQRSKTPDAEAIVCGGIRLTYGQMLARASVVASKLRESGVGHESLVGVCVDRSWEMVAGILGVLKAGGAYVPMDPAYPKERLAFMLSDAKARVLLTQRKQLDSLPKTNANVICLDDFDWDDSIVDTLTRVEPRVQNGTTQSPLAYVIYTSGSTGQPKGVAIEHRNAVAFVSWAKEVFNSEELSGVLASTSICFDLSIFELFVPLCCGGKVILAENALALPSLPAASEVKLINTVPSAIRELLRIKGVPESVQVVNLAGEPLATSLVNDIYRQTGIRKVYDLYGPTETTTYSTFTVRRPNEPPSIGRPLANEQVYLLDGHMQPVPIGVPGDLYIGGDGVARGYLNQPELTAAKFISNPFPHNSFGNGAANRIYKTGDLARWLANGRLEFLGRRDHQVKVRGFRIELGEIETALKKQPAVRDAVVLAREDQPGLKRLVAYVVTRELSENANADGLREALKAALPAYMLPSAFVFLQSLPLTPNGKVDRKALAAPPEAHRNLTEDFLPPSSPIEQQLATFWREVLHMKEIGARDNFFDVGGNSLLAVQVVSRIRESFNVELPISALFDSPTISALAQQVSAHQGEMGVQRTPAIAPVSRDGVLPLSFVQERLWFLDHIHPEGHAYNVPIAFRLKGELQVDVFQRALDGIVARHESLRTTFCFVDSNLCQVIAPETAIKISVESLPDESRAQEFVDAEAQLPFDLVKGPLIRAKLLRLGESDHIFVVVMHHIISDGWSLGIFLREFEAEYRAVLSNGSDPQLPPLPVQYADFAAWRRCSIQGAALENELNFWKKKLQGAPPAIALSTDSSASAIPNGKAGHVTVRLSTPLTQAILKFGRHNGITPFIVLMAALAITLRKWSDQEDMVIGTVVAGRNRRELENVIGCFMNFLPLRIPIRNSESGREILNSVQIAAMEAQNHQDCPFEKIVEAINPERKLNQNPLYNVALLFQNFSLEFFKDGPLRAIPFPAYLDNALLDLRFEVEQTGQELSLLCEYNAGLFVRATVEQLVARCSEVLETLVRAPDTAFKEFPGFTVAKSESSVGGERKKGQTIAIAGTFTVEPVAEPLRFWTEKLGISVEIEFAPYNQAFQQLLDPGSLFATNRRGLNVILLRFEDWMTSNQARDRSPLESVNRNLGEFTAALKQASLRGSAPYLVCVCPVSDPATFAKEASTLENALVAELKPLNGVHMITSAELARLYPVSDFCDPSADELGHIPYTAPFFTALATAIARKFHALNRAAHKVIVLDLDQTLWSGVCGEDGPQGICLDESRIALQRFMLDQQKAGRLLCVCSKNNEEDVWQVFEQRPDMPLRREHFAAWRLNWSPKSENLKALARELQLSLDSFIFIDDNPVECAEVEANCPEVLTLQLPNDPGAIPRFLEHCWVFDHLKLTDEDRHRAESYKQNQQRERLRSCSVSLADFVESLEIVAKMEPMSDEQLPRVSQLTQRTNQFNCNTVRRTESEIQEIRKNAELITVTVSDRFGDYGLTGVVIYRPKENRLDVETLLLSCRILGRGIEHRVLARLGEIAQERGLDWVDVHFNPSPKNKPANDFLQTVGEKFRQPLNGGYVFRFPAAFASQVSFNPGGRLHENALAIAESWERPAPNTEHAAASSHPSKFSVCGEIALEFNDPAKIHAVIESKTVARKSSSATYVAPRTEVERQLCDVWQKLLHIERVGITDNFFEVGGHSLLAVRLFAEVQRIFGKKLPLVTIFQSPSIERLANAISQRIGEVSNSLLVPLQPNGSKPPLFLVHGAGGDILWGYANLSAHLPADQPIYGIKSCGQAGREEFARIEEMASCYVRELRAFHPKGPYYLGGYCFGGNVAYEMAHQLHSQGEEVAFVALLDSAPANAGYEKIHWWKPKYGARFVRNLCYWLADFAEQSPKERREFVTRKLRVLMRRLTEQNDSRTVDLESVIDPSHFPENELRLWKIHLDALKNHVQQPYPGEVLLLRTRGQPILCSLEDDFCWGKLAQRGVQVSIIPGSHENIFMEPKVRSLAKELGYALTQAQKGKQ